MKSFYGFIHLYVGMSLGQLLLFSSFLSEIFSKFRIFYCSTLAYLMNHLHRVSLSHPNTGMTAKNLAIVWAPNLLRCQTLEEAGGVEALQGVAVQAIVTEYLIKYCHIIFSEQSPTSEHKKYSTKSCQQSFPLSSPMKLLTLEEAQRQAHTINKTNKITPVTQYRKKGRPWKRKALVAGKETREGTHEESTKYQSRLFTTPGSAYWEPVKCSVSADKEHSQAEKYKLARVNIEHPVECDIDMDADMETKTIPNKRGVVPSSPVILRCSRRQCDNKMDLSCREARSSIRDRFRNFTLSPVTSLDTFEMMGDHASDEESSKSQPNNVKHLDLHRHDSIEYIDASSEEESEYKESPSTKMCKIKEKIKTPDEEITEKNIKLDATTYLSSKEEAEEKDKRKMHKNTKNENEIIKALDTKSQNIECQTFAINNFSKGNNAMKQLGEGKNIKCNSQRNSSHTVKHEPDGGPIRCMETKAVRYLIYKYSKYS